MLFISCMSYNFLDVPSVAEKILMSSSMIVGLPNSPFNSVNFCFMYFETLLLDAETFIIVMSS